MEKAAFRRQMLIYWPALGLSLVLRTILKFGGIDPATGFYLGKGALPLVFHVVLGVGVLALAREMFGHRTVTWYHAFYNDKRLNAAAICLGAMQFLYSAEVLGVQLGKTEVHPFNIKANWLLLVLCVLSGFTMFVIGTMGLRKTAGDFSVVLSLFPVIWQALLLVITFNRFTTLITISENVIVILFMVASCMFWLGHARTLCNVGSIKGRNYAVPMGLALSLLGFVAVLPGYVLAIANGFVFASSGFSFGGSLLILAQSVYALVFAFALRRSVAKQLG